MNGIVVVAVLSIMAGAVVMLLGVAAKRSLEIEAKHEVVLYEHSRGINDFGANPGTANVAFMAATRGTDVGLDVTTRTTRQQGISSGKPVL